MPSYSYRCGRFFYSSSEIRELKVVRYVSVVVPTFNEEHNIVGLVSALSSALKGFDFEIVVVDDDSSDKTPEILDRLAVSGKGRVAVLHRKGVKGIFSALSDGIRASRGRIAVIMDADFSHPPGQVPLLVAALENGFDFVVGSRFLRGSVFEAPFSRKYGPMLLNFVCRFVLGLKATDIFTGFHAMRRDKFMQIRFRYPSVWGEFDMELLYRAQKAGFKVKDVPFSYRFRSEGKSKSSGLRILKYAFAYLRRAFELRLFG